MNNKQKTIVTIYIVVSCLIILGEYLSSYDLLNGALLYAQANGDYSGANNILFNMLANDALGLTLLGIPTLILFKVWKDKKIKAV